MSQHRKIVAAEDLRRFVGEIFAARGMAPADARWIAELIVFAELRGVDSHGVTRLPGYLAFIDKGFLDPKARPDVRPVIGASLVVDGHKAAGPVTMMVALDEAANAARRNGISLALVHHTTHTGAVGYYAEWAGKRGFASIIVIGGVPNMAYHGARVASVATGPLTIGVPGGAEGPIVLDMATSVAAWGKLRQAKLAGLPIPDGWALSEAGEPTTDPVLAMTPLPVGGPKGAGMALMFEYLASVMAGAPILSAMVGASGRGGHTQNAMVILIDVAAFRPLEEFAADVRAYAAILKDLPTTEGVDEILLPGERGGREARQRREKGIPLGPSAWKDIETAAVPLGVALPKFRLA